MTHSFVTTAQVRFAHCDVAGIVFYPRYFEMLNGAVEDWFEQALECDFKTLHQSRNLGVPTVKLDAEFVAPSMLNDRLTIKMTPLAVGRSSCTLSVVFECDNQTRLTARIVLVCMHLSEQRASAWPDDIRARMSQGQTLAS